MKRQIIFSWMLVVIWMGLIFWFSAQPGTESAEMSSSVVVSILQFIDTIAPNWDLDPSVLHLVIRKGAHFFVYAILGLLTVNACYRSGVSGTRLFLLSAAICVLYAISDEVHQLFVAGRDGNVIDVLLDSTGSIGGIGLFLLRPKRGRFSN